MTIIVIQVIRTPSGKSPSALSVADCLKCISFVLHFLLSFLIVVLLLFLFLLFSWCYFFPFLFCPAFTPCPSFSFFFSSSFLSSLSYPWFYSTSFSPALTPRPSSSFSLSSSIPFSSSSFLSYLNTLLLPSSLLPLLFVSRFPLPFPENQPPTRLTPVLKATNTTHHDLAQNKSDAAKCIAGVNVRICIAHYVPRVNGREGPQRTFRFA